MKSKDKSEGCFNCEFSRNWHKDKYSDFTINHAMCTITKEINKWDYVCKKWRLQL